MVKQGSEILATPPWVVMMSDGTLEHTALCHASSIRDVYLLTVAHNNIVQLMQSMKLTLVLLRGKVSYTITDFIT